MTFKEHLRRNMNLAVPVMITQAGQIMVNLVDNFMVGGLGGRYDYVVDEELGRVALGAVSLGNAVFVTAMVVAFGFSFAISPLVAEADAKKDKEGVSQVFTHGFVLNMILAAILVVILVLAKPLMQYMDQPKEVIDRAIPYLNIQILTLIPIMIFQTFRQFSEGLSLTIPVTIATIIGNVVNVIFNIGFIYGYWGFPRLEVAGAAWGTLIARVFMVGVLIITLWNFKKTREYLQAVKFKEFSRKMYVKVLKLGVPTAFTSFFEVSAFTVSAFVCGYSITHDLAGEQLAEINLAAHQITMSMASTTFMMCIGLGVAATVRVGYQLGLKKYDILRDAGLSAIFMVIVFMVMMGLIMIVFRHQLPGLYLDDKEVIALASKLLIIAALFQLSDGIQLVVMGALRGMQDVIIPTIIAFVSYWVIALPLGILLAVYFEMRALGMWIGLFSGLTVAAILLLLRYEKQTKKLIYGNSKILNS